MPEIRLVHTGARILKRKDAKNAKKNHQFIESDLVSVAVGEPGVPPVGSGEMGLKMGRSQA